MALTDTETLKNRQAGQAVTFGLSSDAAGVAEIAKQHSFVLIYDKASDDGMASTATAETYTGRYTPYKARVKSVTYVATTGGITADASNNAVITVSQRDSTASNPLAVATYTSNVAGGSVTQGVPKAMTLTGANVIVPAGSTFTFTIAKGGTGVVVRAGSFIVELEKI